MLSQPDTAVVREGEKILKQFLKASSCIAPLINQIRTNPDEAIRHHAALLLKKRAATLYNKFNAAQKLDLRGQLLTVMTNEPIKSIGTALAGVVASVAKGVFSTEHQWPELFILLQQLSLDSNENHRCLNYSLLEQVTIIRIIRYHWHIMILAAILTHFAFAHLCIDHTAFRACRYSAETSHSHTSSDVHCWLPRSSECGVDSRYGCYSSLYKCSFQRSRCYALEMCADSNVECDARLLAKRYALSVSHITSHHITWHDLAYTQQLLITLHINR